MKDDLQHLQKDEMYNLHKSTKNDKNNCASTKSDLKKLSTIFDEKSPKNGVIHGVIHVIHKKEGNFDVFYTGKKEQPFCEEVINFDKIWKNSNLQLTFQM